MNAKATEPALPPTPGNRAQAQVAELHTLENQFPEPTRPEVMADWEWLYAECNAGRLFDLYGRFVAVCEKQILGTDDDELALRIRMSREHNRHPERFVISYLGDYRDYP